MERNQRLLLLVSVFIVAASGLVYELIAGAISSYLLGDAVTQFSLIIGLFLSAMGLGSYATQFIHKELLWWFVRLELGIALMGGISSVVIFATSAMLPTIFTPIFYSFCIGIGAMVGAEIPLLIRLLKQGDGVEKALSNVLALDYVGALFGSLLFPFVVLPWIGLSRASVVFGLLNLFVAWLGSRMLTPPQQKQFRWQGLGVLTILLSLFIYSERMVHFFEDVLYQDEIVYAEDTPYQRIVLTRWRSDIRLFLNGHIQFSSIDEARYHESLVHPALVGLNRPAKSILLLGGGDGMAVRELLKWPSIEHIDLVDIDPKITELGQNHPMLQHLNNNALDSELVTIIHQDAMLFLQESETFYDVVLIDLPDPNSETLSKLYSTSFYQLVHRRLTSDGIMVTQATSPYFATEAFWCIAQTVSEVFEQDNRVGTVYPYHVNVPSFGEWGFVMGSKRSLSWDNKTWDLQTRFLTAEHLPTLFIFGKDIDSERVTVESNHLLDPILYQYYKRGWEQYNQ